METQLPNGEQLIRSTELERFTPYSRYFWAARRSAGDGPPFTRLGKRTILYRWNDVRNWLEERLAEAEGARHG